ncbi:MAG: hypothetical protein ACRELW_11515, partial [Candidatus Rokuibacteriota bacterium]
LRSAQARSLASHWARNLVVTPPQKRVKATLTLRGYAKHRRAARFVGGSLQAVQKAIRRGWIIPDDAGRIEPVEADRRWAQLHSPKVYTTHTTRATPVAASDSDEAIPPVIVAYLQLIEAVNTIFDLNHRVALAESAAELKENGAATKRRKCWRTLWDAWRKLKIKLDVFQQELFDVSVLVEQIQGRRHTHKPDRVIGKGPQAEPNSDESGGERIS